MLEAIKPKLAELVKNISIFDSDSPKTALIAGDADLGMVWTAEAEMANRETGTFGYVYPSGGAVQLLDGYGMLKDAPHPDAAYAWLNYSLQGDVFWKMLEEFPYTMPNQAALDYAKENQPELYDAYMNSEITNTPEEIWERGQWVQDVGDATCSTSTCGPRSRGANGPRGLPPAGGSGPYIPLPPAATMMKPRTPMMPKISIR